MALRVSFVCVVALALSACAGPADDTDSYDIPSVAQTNGGGTSDGGSQGQGRRLVKIGLDGPRFDACASSGEVTNLNPQGDNYLSVRAAPTSAAEESDRLQPGSRFAMCQKVGDWYGVIYPPQDSENVNCGTGSPVSSKRDYEGTCRSGWINENFVKLVAG